MKLKETIKQSKIENIYSYPLFLLAIIAVSTFIFPRTYYYYIPFFSLPLTDYEYNWRFSSDAITSFCPYLLQYTSLSYLPIPFLTFTNHHYNHFKNPLTNQHQSISLSFPLHQCDPTRSTAIIFHISSSFPTHQHVPNSSILTRALYLFLLEDSLVWVGEGVSVGGT